MKLLIGFIAYWLHEAKWRLSAWINDCMCEYLARKAWEDESPEVSDEARAVFDEANDEIKRGYGN